MNKRLFLLLTVMCVGVCASCSTYNEQEAEDQKKQELLVGKWACQRPGVYSGYDFYVFNSDGTGLFGHYSKPNANPNPSRPNPLTSWLRYKVVDGKIAFCYTNTDSHPMRPGEVCGEYDDILNFYEFTVDETTLDLNIDGEYPYTRVTKWSDVGLPDILLPEDMEQIVGKWMSLVGTNTSYVYSLYVFRADSTGIQGCYVVPRTDAPPTLDYVAIRYAIVGGQIGICPDYTHTHPMRPGEICAYGNPLYFYDLKLSSSGNSLEICNYLQSPLYRVSKWSEFGAEGFDPLPDDLLPE